MAGISCDVKILLPERADRQILSGGLHACGCTSPNPLFAWDCLEDSPTLKTIKQLLDIIPDGPLLDSLQQARGKGRDDVPLRTAWGILVLSVALRHPSIDHCLAELRRNESLRKLLGIESEETVPRKWNLSRFLERLGEEPHLTHLHAIFDTLIERLGDAVPDLGRNTAGDATYLNARRKKKAARRRTTGAFLKPAAAAKSISMKTAM